MIAFALDKASPSHQTKCAAGWTRRRSHGRDSC